MKKPKTAEPKVADGDGVEKTPVAAPIGGEEAEVTGDGSGQPAEPAEDHITAFDRNLERLSIIAEEAEFESGSLVGDIRDALLDMFRNRLKPWSQMSQGEQTDTARGLEAVAKQVLRKLVIVLAEQDDVSVHATLKGYAVDGDTFKLKVVAKGDEDTAVELFKMDGHDVVMIRADSRRFHGQRRDAAVDVDQPALKFEGEEAPDHPDDDSDLAGGPDAEPESEEVDENDQEGDD